MAVLTITIPPAVTQRVLDNFALVYGWTATIPDPANPGATLPNPENLNAFVKRKMVEHIKDVVKTGEASAAGAAATAAAVAKVDTEIVVT